MKNIDLIKYEKEIENVINSHPEIPLEVTRIILSAILRNVERLVEKVANDELKEESNVQENNMA